MFDITGGNKGHPSRRTQGQIPRVTSAHRRQENIVHGGINKAPMKEHGPSMVTPWNSTPKVDLAAAHKGVIELHPVVLSVVNPDGFLGRAAGDAGEDHLRLLSHAVGGVRVVA
jgi:hypothetical protein